MTRNAGGPGTADRPLIGILLMIGFCALAPLGDAVAKLIGASMPLVQLVAFRFAIQAVLLVPLVLVTGRSLAMPARLLALTVLRTVLHVIGIGAMFLSLRYLPLADAIAIAYVMPFILLLLGRLVLHEEVGARRIGASAVGFAGTMLVIQPSLAAVGAAALLPLVVALAFALFMLVTREIARETDPIALQAVSGALAAAILLPVVVLAAAGGRAGFDPVAPDAREWALVIGLGLIGTAAHLFLTWSLRFAPAATLAPMQYLEIPFATAIGLAVFGDLPDPLAAIGIVVTVAAGLYVIHREHRATMAERAGERGTDGPN